MNLVLFDLDNTLLRGDTDVEWLDFLVEQGVLPASAHEANHEMDRRYGRGEASTLEYVRFYLGYYPAFDMATLRGFRERFIRERMAPLMLPAARKLIQDQKSHLVALITATNRFLVEPIAADFGIEHVMATEPQIVDGRFTGDVVGPPCMREGKIEHLNRWMAQRGQRLSQFGETWFYSDSINDLPLLERVTHPVAVDAGAQLAEIASRRGWRQLSLR